MKNQYQALLKLAYVCLLVLGSIYALSAQTNIFSEDFKGYGNGATTGNGWSTSIAGCNLSSSGDYFEIKGNKLEARDLDCEAVWLTNVIDISAYADIAISVDIQEAGNMEANDYMHVFYKLNGGAEQAFDTHGYNFDDFNKRTAEQTGLNGSTLQVIVRVRNDNGSEMHRILEAHITGTPSGNGGGSGSGGSNGTISLTATITDVSCHGSSDGEIDLVANASGGAGSVSYTWSTGAVSEDLSGLQAGNYSVTAEYSGASATASFTIAQPGSMALSNTVTNVSCNGGNNGAIDLSVSGGSAPYSYNWSNSSTSQDISSLTGGIYMVTVTDDNGCTTNSIIGVEDATAISIAPTASEETSPGAEDGSISLIVSGGAGSYSYSWSNGASTQDINGLNGGNYTVTITDGNSCTTTQVVEVSTLSSSSGLAGYCYRKTIEIQEGQVPGSSALTDFPVLVSFTDADLKTTANGGKVEHNSGYDIRFTADDGLTELSYQLGSYNASTGAASFWVKVPSLSATSNTTLYMYYGNDNVSTDGSSTATWKADYKGVWHLDENLPVNQSIFDATANSMDGQKQGSTHASAYVSGKIGMAYHLDGSNDYYLMDTDLNTWLGGSGTVTAWIKTSQWGNNNAWMAPGITGIEESGGGNDIFWGVIDGSGKLFAQAGNGSNAKTINRVNDNAWHHVAITRNASNGQIKVYMDGNLAATATSETGTKTNSFYSIGRIEDTGGSPVYLDGILDEVRVLNSILDANWIEAEYNNQNNPATFYTIGSEEYMDCDGSGGGGNSPAGYGYCKTIASNPNYVYGSGTHTDFPFLVSITSNDLRTTSHGGYMQNSNGYDIVFTSEDGATVYPHEMESYSATTGALLAWVKLPSLSTSSATTFKLYYGNAAISTNQSSSGTWTSAYKAIYHFDNSLGDATANGNNATNHSSANTNNGKIGKGRSFNGSNQYITASNSSSLNVTGNTLTISAWAKVSNVLQDAPFAVKGIHVNQEQYMLGVDTESQRDDTYNMRTTTNTGHYRYNVGEPNFTQWDYVSMVYDGSLGANPRMKMYVNGVLVSSQNASGNISSNSGDLYIGKRPVNDNRYYNGSLDEIRIQDIARSADWLKTEYYNQNNPASTITVTSCTVESPPCFTWLGTTSASWATGSNWSCGEVPTCADTVTIPAGTPNAPTITSGSIGYAKNLIIESGATIQMGSTGVLNICGNLELNGTLDLSGGTVHFVGNNEQAISGNSPIFYKLVINNTSATGVVATCNVEVDNTIAFTDGHFFNGTDTLFLNKNSGNGTTILEYSEESFVVGRLNRKLARNTQDYIFPVGKEANKLYWVSLENDNLEGTNNLTVYFTNLERHDDNQLNVTAQDITFTRLCPEGMWVIEPDNQPSNGKYTIDVSIENFAGLQDNNFGVLKRPKGGNANAWNNGNGTMDLLGLLGRTVNAGLGRLKNLTSFSEFGVGTGGGSDLPIKLSSFEATYVPEENWVELDWETQVEVNNDYFIVQRSIDGRDFEDVANVDGAGNSTVIITYKAYDQNPPKGMVYYRLKQIDFDKKYSYSEMVPVMITGEHAKTDVKLYPNPASSMVNIDLLTDSKQVTIILMTMSGNAIKYLEAEHAGGEFRAQVELDGALPSGQYLVRISYGTTETIKKLMIIH